MKLIKLSLVAALAAGAFSAANATPLEDAIKNIDVSGVLRYRNNTSNPWTKADYGSGIIGKRTHNYRAQLNFSGAIADNFKAFVQFDYNANDGAAGGNGATTDSNDAAAHVRQLYLTYSNEDAATSVIVGRQQLNTIWTDNGIDGLVGTAAKVVNNSIDGLTLAAFAVDNYNFDEQGHGYIDNDGHALVKGDNNDIIYSGDASPVLSWGNTYGAAAIASYEVAGGQLNPQLWLAYMHENAFLYALDTAYSTTIFDGINWNIEGAYLGNSLDSTLKKHLQHEVTGGNFFALRGTITVDGWDASLGGLYYGNKKKGTVTVIEDQGNLGSLLAGEEIFYTNGSRLNGDIGRNIFGYITAGYTFDETVRVGADLVYGGTDTSHKVQSLYGPGAGKKLEAVARVNYKYSPKLSFSTFYSYVDVDKKYDSTRHDAVRLEALYKF